MKHLIKFNESKNIGYDNIGYFSYQIMVGRSPYGVNNWVCDFTNCIEFSDTDKNTISKYLRSIKSRHFQFHDVSEMQKLSADPLSDNQLEWLSKYNDKTKRKILEIFPNRGESAIEVQKLEDEWFLAIYMPIYQGPRIPERYLYYKCDQIEGLINLISQFY